MYNLKPKLKKKKRNVSIQTRERRKKIELNKRNPKKKNTVAVASFSFAPFIKSDHFGPSHTLRMDSTAKFFDVEKMNNVDRMFYDTISF